MNESADGSRLYLLHANNMWEEKENIASISPDDSLYHIIKEEEDEDEVANHHIDLKISCVWSVVHPSYEQPFRYVFCSKCFTNPLKLKYPYECGSCGEVFSEGNDLVYHMRMHTDQHRYHTPRYGESLQLKTNSDGHLKSHRMKVEHDTLIYKKPNEVKYNSQYETRPGRPIKTEEIGFNGRYEKELDCRYEKRGHASVKTEEVDYHVRYPKLVDTNQQLQHPNWVKTEDKPYICNVCGKLYPYRVNLERHMKLHYKENDLKCTICGEVAATKRQLRRHMGIHTGERFPCPVCNKSYTALRNLQQHMNIHDRDRAHTCELCGKLFCTKQQLQRHTAVHTGERAHKCGVCARSFTQKSSLIMHMKNHENHEPR